LRVQKITFYAIYMGHRSYLSALDLKVDVEGVIGVVWGVWFLKAELEGGE
jgi:hypothetical protein